ncbi:MAG TPA: pyridoxamine 5'-phosphate oxidase family protein [Candidatus Hydrogenedentes bacterium]|jgi:hypothetical protein|nr:pyridoxamine 5'-phosphate oxidase family protein [Candidatus Hydrogenedentota bacterium]
MADFYESLTDDQIAFIERQYMFFVSTAYSTGRINLSPKGMDTFRVLDSSRVAYLDMMGSGNETCAHIQNDGRVTLMLCSFDQKPNILRIYGQGKVVGASDDEWDELIASFDEIHGQRQIIVIQVESTQDSCGYAVPHYEYKEERDTLRKYGARYSPEELAKGREMQTKSIDGLPIQPSV